MVRYTIVWSNREGNVFCCCWVSSSFLCVVLSVSADSVSHLSLALAQITFFFTPWNTYSEAFTAHSHSPFLFSSLYSEVSPQQATLKSCSHNLIRMHNSLSPFVLSLSLSLPDVVSAPRWLPFQLPVQSRRSCFCSPQWSRHRDRWCLSCTSCSGCRWRRMRPSSQSTLKTGSNPCGSWARSAPHQYQSIS